MSFLIKVINKINCIFYKYILKSKNVIIARKSRITRDTIFEQGVIIGKASYLVSSYIGRGTYIGDNCILNFAKIGRFCSIANNVIVASGQHPLAPYVTTSPCFYGNQLKKIKYNFSFNSSVIEHKFVDVENKYHISIGNDVWIGTNVIIMEGISIGDGSVIGSGAVVTKNVEDYTIVGGNPAKNIKMRFNDSQVIFLKDFQWWNKSNKWLKENSKYFSNIDEFIMNNSNEVI